MALQLLCKPFTPFHVQYLENLLLFTRSYSKSNKHDNPFNHEDWPLTKKPTPYEVLNITPQTFHPIHMKKNYFKIAKIYHPDIASNRILLDHKGNQLSHEHKSERFKMLTDAYNLLRDTRKKAMYDQFKIGWMDTQNLVSHPFKSGGNPNAAYTAQHNPRWNDHAYWSAGTWEDYQNMGKMNDPSLRQEKMKVFAALVSIMVVSAAIQGWIILENVEKDMLVKRKINDDCLSELDRVYSSYGLDDCKISRIKRFLWFRTLGLYVNKNKLDKSAEENEKLVEEILCHKTN